VVELTKVKGSALTRDCLKNCLLIGSIFALFVARPAYGQATHRLVDPLLRQPIQSSPIVADELRHFMLARVPSLSLPATAKQWQMEAERIRTHELSVLYHGWPQAWIDAPPKFEKVGTIERPGYRIVKLRYEIVPGFYSTALLYEPEKMQGKLPAILNVNGHGPGGKAVEHKQKRCINQARHGAIALSLEWLDFGELQSPENGHNAIQLLDFAGSNGVGLFYLAMRRGLDYLYEDADVDRSRIGVTGLSGGGWQTMLLSSLDPRVVASVPVAGFSSLTTAIEHPEYAGDAEQNGSDMRRVADYAQLMAVRAPRPTLLIYNDMDDCCFRAGIVKQGVYSDIKPFFNLLGAPEGLQWYENQDPGTHNYQIDSRERSYRFFNSIFHLNASDKEDSDTDVEVRSYDDLVVGLPKDNLTIVKLAKLFAASLQHTVPAQPDASWRQSQRNRLKEVIRYTAVTVTHAWPVSATHEKGLESHAYRFEFSNGLSATGVLFRSLTAPENAPVTILISDAGLASMGDEVGNDVDKGQRVLVFDPMFFGENVPGTTDRPSISNSAQLLNSIGERPLGLEAAQIAAVVHWLHRELDHGSATPTSTEGAIGETTSPVHIATTGPRSETVALSAAAINPDLFSELEARKTVSSLMDVFDHPQTYRGAPELLCLDLYRDFDFDVLKAIASPVKVDLNASPPQLIFWR
jgi:dienelactone hydrolase